MKPKNKSIKWNPQIAYVVGLITTDGNLSPDGRHLSIISKDIQLLETAKHCLQIKNKIAPKMSGYTTKKNCYHIQFGNVVFYKWLVEIGLMPNKSKRIKSLKVPNKYFFNFLRGHLDGDGCIRKFQDPVYPNSQRLYTVFHSASFIHLKWLQQRISFLLNIYGFIEPSIREFRLTFAKKESLKLLAKIYPNHKVPCLRRKYKIAKEFLKNNAEVVKLENTYASGAYVVRLEGSNPSLGTN